jgi:GntR family transcriptional regulator/MocR family aminotransferase
MDPDFQLPINLPSRDSRNLRRVLHGQLRAAILDGRLQPGSRLPATRALAAAYGLSRNTAVAAYDLLLSEGYLVTRPRAGVYVADVRPRLPDRRAPTSVPATDSRLNAFWRKPPGDFHEHSRIFPRFDFRLGVPDKRFFPFEIWRRLSARWTRSFDKTPAAYVDPQGLRALREAIAKHVSFTRAVACRPDDIVVTAGCQQAVDLLGRILITSGRTVVAIENPGYPPLRAAFAAAGAKIVPVRVDHEGIDVHRLPTDTRVICVTPSHQFPLGTTMTIRRRAALLEFAQRRGAVVIEDDYDGEFRFGARPLDALQTLDRSELVFYVGTFSNSIFPEIRLGFVVPPPWARPALIAAKQCADGHSAALEQFTLAAFIEEGYLARHVRKMRQVYGARHQKLLACLQSDFSPWLEPIPSAVGLHMAALARRSLDADKIAERAQQAGVRIYSLRDFYCGRPERPGLVFGYGAIRESDIVEGLSLVRRLLQMQATV